MQSSVRRFMPKRLLLLLSTARQGVFKSMIFYSSGRFRKKRDLDFRTLYVETEIVHCGVSSRQYEAVQGGPSGRGQPFVDIAIKVAP